MNINDLIKEQMDKGATAEDIKKMVDSAIESEKQARIQKAAEEAKAAMQKGKINNLRHKAATAFNEYLMALMPDIFVDNDTTKAVKEIDNAIQETEDELLRAKNWVDKFTKTDSVGHKYHPPMLKDVDTLIEEFLRDII